MTEAPAPAEGTPLLDGAEAPASAPVDNKERERLAVEKAQETGPDGLSSETYAARFEEYGPNVLEEVKKNECLVFLSYFWGPMPIMIWVATLIVTLEKDYDDMAVLLTLQAVNGVVGYFEERSAGDAIAALKKSLAPKANVKRDGKWQEVEVRERARPPRPRVRARGAAGFARRRAAETRSRRERRPGARPTRPGRARASLSPPHHRARCR